MSRQFLLCLLVWLAAGCDRRELRPGRALPLERCRLPGVAAQARCGTLEVWEDKKASAGRKLSLHVAVLPALAAHPEPDPLFILAGGPGQSASGVAKLLGPAFERIRRKRDLVFVDQRGTGRSGALECELEPPGASLAQRLKEELDEASLARCARDLSVDHDLRHYGTQVAMDDLDQVRAALGYERVNLWGASYGTRAALVYLRTYPQRVRTLTLDGVAPLALVLPKEAAKDADRALRLLFEACAQDPACERAWPRLQARFEALLARLEQAPARATVPHPLTGEPEAVEVGKEALLRILRVLLYEPEATSLVPLTVDRAAAGDLRPLVAQSELVSSGLAANLAVGMFLSVVCTEDAPLLEEAEVRAAAQGTYFGPSFALDVLRGCRSWPRGEVEEGFREPVASEVPVLLLSGELDPVTPPRWGEEAARHLSHSRHVILPATGHGTLSNACARRLVETFLETADALGLEEDCQKGTRPPFFVDFAGPLP